MTDTTPTTIWNVWSENLTSPAERKVVRWYYSRFNATDYAVTAQREHPEKLFYVKADQIKHDDRH